MKCTLTSLMNAHSIVPWRLFILTAPISLGCDEPILICRDSFFTDLTEFYQLSCVCNRAFDYIEYLLSFTRIQYCYQITLSVFINLCYFCWSLAFFRESAIFGATWVAKQGAKLNLSTYSLTCCETTSFNFTILSSKLKVKYEFSQN